MAHDRASEPPLGVGRAVLLAWILAMALSLIDSSSPSLLVHIVGYGALTIALVGIGWLVVGRVRYSRRSVSAEPAGRNVSPERAAPDEPDEVDGLRRHSTTAAAHVRMAFDLLGGPLRGHLESSQIDTATKALRASLSELAALDEKVARARTVRAGLRQSLPRSRPKTPDPDLRELHDRLTELQGRQRAVVDDLDRAAVGLQDAWEPFEQELLEHFRRRELVRARDDAEQVASVVDPPTEASARLSDAVDDVRARLRGISEVESINDRVLGDES